MNLIQQAEDLLYLKQSAQRGCLEEIRNARSMDVIADIANYYQLDQDIKVLTAQINFAKAMEEGE